MRRTTDARRGKSAESLPRELPTWLVAVVLAAAIWIVFGRSLAAPWIFDDRNSVLNNRSIQSIWPLIGSAERPGPLRPLVGTPISARPLVNLSLAANYQFSEHDPCGYRAVNVLLHLLNSLLLYAIVWRTLRLPRFVARYDDPVAKWLALVVALLWAVHPLVTETVVYVTQRTELMVALFYLATLYASTRYWTAARVGIARGWLLAAIAACLAGAASKEVMVSAPLVVLLFDWTFMSTSWRDVWRRHWPLYAGLATSWLVLAALQIGTPHGESAGFSLGVSLVDWWSTQAEIFIMYLKLAIWPAPLAIHYEWPELETPRTAWMYIAATVAIVLATMWLIVRKRPAGPLLAAMLAILAPTHIIPVTTEIAAERRMYLPLAALVALCVCGVLWLERRRASPTGGRAALSTMLALALCLASAYGIVSARRVAAFLDPVDLWRENVILQPYNLGARSNLASELIQSGDRQEAIEHLRTALELNPDFNQGRYQLALALMAEGTLDAAAVELQELVRRKPEAYRVRNNLGVVLFSAGRFPEAIVEFEKVLELQPDFSEARENLNRARQASVLPTDAE
jgi:cytochrome c-type biogenesis protein CcmH/NrfG